MDIRQSLLEGRAELPRLGQVQATEDRWLPYIVVDGSRGPIAYFNEFLRELVLGDASPLTCRSYGHALLRWWRVLTLVEVEWDKATRTEVELLVGWLRSTPNPQRRRHRPDADPSGSVNLKTGKPGLAADMRRRRSTMRCPRRTRSTPSICTSGGSKAPT